MPVIRDSSGRSMYVSVKDFFSEKPEDFFRSDYKEYQNRVTEARIRVFEIIRFNLPRSPFGRGLNCDIKITKDGLNHRIDWLTDLVDGYDGKKARNLQAQRKLESKHGTQSYGYRLRSPQDVKRRRSALFGGADIPAGYFGEGKLVTDERNRFVDLMRWFIIREAITVMWANHELELVSEVWYIPVSVMDRYVSDIKNAHHKKPRIKDDNRSYHGRPQRDRYRQTMAA